MSRNGIFGWWTWVCFCPEIPTVTRFVEANYRKDSHTQNLVKLTKVVIITYKKSIFLDKVESSLCVVN
jgi:hypothetical protein